MNEGELASGVMQFGAAGLMGWMWLTERRAAAVREKNLADAHERLMSERSGLEVVLRAIENSTRALTALEVGQRQVVHLLTRLAVPWPAGRGREERGGRYGGAGERVRREAEPAAGRSRGEAEGRGPREAAGAQGAD